MARFTVPYVNLAEQHAPLKAELLEAVAAVLDEGKFILGPQVEAFETRFADLCGTRHAVGVNSGTDALVLALQVLGVGPGDEVITVPNSFVASTTCIRLVGATPRFVDVGADYLIDVSKIARRHHAEDKGHFAGSPYRPSVRHECDHGDCQPPRTLRRRGLRQAVLAEHQGRRVGSIGTIGCFSLHPLKTLNACGDGGVLTTNDPDLDVRLRVARNIGLRTREDCVVWSGNSRLDTMQAAILLVKLRHVERWTQRRRENALFYQEAFRQLPQVQVPTADPHLNPVYHTFVIQADRRDELRRYLAEQGVETVVHYPVPIHFTRAAQELGYAAGSFPVAERQAGRIVSLPVHPQLTVEQLAAVAKAVHRFYRSPNA